MNPKLRILALLLAGGLLCGPAPVAAQATHNAELTIAIGDPSGVCSDGRLYINSASGDGFVCYGATWHDYGAPVGGALPAGLLYKNTTNTGTGAPATILRNRNGSLDAELQLDVSTGPDEMLSMVRAWNGSTYGANLITSTTSGNPTAQLGSFQGTRLNTLQAQSNRVYIYSNDSSNEDWSGVEFNTSTGNVPYADFTALDSTTGNSARYRLDETGHDFFTNQGIGDISRLKVTASQITTTAPIRTNNNSAATPAYAFTVDNTTGMFLIGNGLLGFATNGTERTRFTTSIQQWTLPHRAADGSQSAPSYSFTNLTGAGLWYENGFGIRLQTAQISAATSVPRVELANGGTDNGRAALRTIRQGTGSSDIQTTVDGSGNVSGFSSAINNTGGTAYVVNSGRASDARVWLYAAWGGAATEILVGDTDHGVKFTNPTSGKPACSSSTRGRMWRTEGGAGVADTFEICAKDAGDAYAWRALW